MTEEQLLQSVTKWANAKTGWEFEVVKGESDSFHVISKPPKHNRQYVSPVPDDQR